MKRLLWSLVCGALGTAVSPAAALTDYTTNDIALSAGFIPDSGQIGLGEPLFLTLVISNKGTQPFEFYGGRSLSAQRDFFDVTISATNAAGRPVKDPMAGRGMAFNGMIPSVKIEPGREYRHRIFLNHWCEFEQPGEYTITCRRVFPKQVGQPKTNSLTVTTVFPLTVLPKDSARVTDLIGAWGKVVLTNGSLSEAAFALGEFRDPRTISHLAAVVGVGGYSNQAPAIEALQSFPDSAAAADALTNALLSAGRDGWLPARAFGQMRQTGHAVDTLIATAGAAEPAARTRAVWALGWTGSPRAFEPLRAALQDTNATVRYAAAEAIGHLDDTHVTALLKSRLNDDDPKLRIAAVRGLRARKEPMQAEWLTPVIRGGGLNNPHFHDAITLLRLEGGEQAAPGLASCLQFDNPSVADAYNFYLILALEYSPNGPKYHYKWHHDPNRGGTEKELADNRQCLAEIKAWLDRQKAR